MRAPLLLSLFALALLAGIPGCSEETTIVGPETFQVVLTVTDPAGRPVPGLELGLAPDLPEYYQDNRSVPATPAEDQLWPPAPSPFYPSTALFYRSGATGWVRVVVEDIEGARVKVIVDGEQSAGDHRVVWNATDASGERVPSGVYWLHLTRRIQDTIHFEDRVPMIYAALYPDQYLVGITDAAGRIVIEDERLFPSLYPDLPEIPAVDETGTVVGAIQLGPAMRFTLVDPEGGSPDYFVRDVTGPGQVQIVWDPAP